MIIKTAIFPQLQFTVDIMKENPLQVVADQWWCVVEVLNPKPLALVRVVSSSDTKKNCRPKNL
jgi:hypothetical protein